MVGRLVRYSGSHSVIAFKRVPVLPYAAKLLCADQSSVDLLYPAPEGSRTILHSRCSLHNRCVSWSRASGCKFAFGTLLGHL